MNEAAKKILVPKFDSQPGEIPVAGPWEGILKPKLRRLHHAEQEFQQAAVARQEAEQRFGQAQENLKAQLERTRGSVESFLEFHGHPTANLNARWDPDTDRCIVVVGTPEQTNSETPAVARTAREHKALNEKRAREERERLAAEAQEPESTSTERKENEKDGGTEP